MASTSDPLYSAPHNASCLVGAWGLKHTPEGQRWAALQRGGGESGGVTGQAGGAAATSSSAGGGGGSSKQVVQPGSATGAEALGAKGEQQQQQQQEKAGEASLPRQLGSLAASLLTGGRPVTSIPPLSRQSDAAAAAAGPPLRFTLGAGGSGAVEGTPDGAPHPPRLDTAATPGGGGGDGLRQGSPLCPCASALYGSVAEYQEGVRAAYWHHFMLGGQVSS